MKYTLTLFSVFGLMLFFSCKSDREAWLDKGYYFYFDELDHYHIEIESEDVWGLTYPDKGTVQDSILFNMLIGCDHPSSLSDTAFVSELADLGYKKSDVSEKHFDAINEIFREKKYSDVWFAMCMPEFRDILVFKEKSKTVGMAKICFGCRYQYMVGTTADRDSFGMDDDYNKLYDILNLK